MGIRHKSVAEKRVLHASREDAMKDKQRSDKDKLMLVTIRRYPSDEGRSYWLWHHNAQTGMRCAAYEAGCELRYEDEVNEAFSLNSLSKEDLKKVIADAREALKKKS